MWGNVARFPYLAARRAYGKRGYVAWLGSVLSNKPVKKFMVGYEMLDKAQRDLTAE